GIMIRHFFTCQGYYIYAIVCSDPEQAAGDHHTPYPDVGITQRKEKSALRIPDLIPVTTDDNTVTFASCNRVDVHVIQNARDLTPVGGHPAQSRRTPQIDIFLTVDDHGRDQVCLPRSSEKHGNQWD